MLFKSNNEGPGLFKGVMLAYTVLVLHVGLIAAMGLLVLFFRGIIQYMLWIFLIGTAALSISGYLFYRRMKQEGRTLTQMLKSPLFGGRSVEVSILGGMASLKLGQSPQPPALTTNTVDASRQLEDPEALRTREQETLLRLLEKNLITPEEYRRAKQDTQ
jgi:hypothetical protein